MCLEWPFLSLFLLAFFLNSLLVQYFHGLENFSFSVYFELFLVWPAFIKHEYVSCIVSYLLESFYCSSLNF